MSYEIKLPNNNVEYFFDVTNMPDLSHVVYMTTDENDNLLFFNVDLNKIVLLTKNKFLYYHDKFLKKELKSPLPNKKTWFSFYIEYQNNKDDLENKSRFTRLVKAYNSLNFKEQQLAVIEFAEGKKMRASLSKEEQALINKFRTLGPFEREAIAIQLDALAGEKSLIKK